MGAHRKKKHCPQCGAVIDITAKLCRRCRDKAAYIKRKEENMIVTRKCHDCGKPTNNYRCSACWQEYRRKQGLQLEVDIVPGWEFVA